MANEVEKFINTQWGSCSATPMRRALRRLIKKAYMMKIRHEQVDPHYRTKEVLAGMRADFKNTLSRSAYLKLS